MDYAIIETGGKQYKVNEGGKVQIEKIDAEAGHGVEFTRILAVSKGGQVQYGSPILETAKVSGEIVRNARHSKVNVFKMKRRKGYSKRFGHRQAFTEVLIKEISA